MRVNLLGFVIAEVEARLSPPQGKAGLLKYTLPFVSNKPHEKFHFQLDG